MFYMTNDEIDKIFPVDDGWSDIDRGDAIGKRQGAKWMRDKLFGNVAKPNACAQLCEGWRDARKELPTADFGVYFVYDKEGSMGFAHYLGEGIFGGWPDVTAWMPLPSPPAFV